ncbi:MAG: hypothetical protein KJZ72_00120 [Anaerolineales bacterium]|nr:hypothetical protein [Anaerolineales bacterium]
MSSWSSFNQGRSIGTVSPEGGRILYDEEHEGGARITLKRGSGYISVSLNIYGWLDHTRFFNSDSEAQREYRTMRKAVNEMMDLINREGVSDLKIWEAISDFVRRFP